MIIITYNTFFCFLIFIPQAYLITIFILKTNLVLYHSLQIWFLRYAHLSLLSSCFFYFFSQLIFIHPSQPSVSLKHPKKHPLLYLMFLHLLHRTSFFFYQHIPKYPLYSPFFGLIHRIYFLEGVTQHSFRRMIPLHSAKTFLNYNYYNSFRQRRE